jgi:hypothetical protein
MAACVLLAIPSHVFSRCTATTSDHIPIDTIKPVFAYVFFRYTDARRVIRNLVHGGTLRTGNVRAALAFVARGEARLGARREDRRDDPRRHAPADPLPVCDHGGLAQSAAQFLDFLKSPAAREIFKAEGFGVIPP